MEGEILIKRVYFREAKELDKLVELQNTVYKSRGLKFHPNNFKRWYINNPRGNVISFNAFDGDKMVAHYACIPTEMIIDGEIRKGVLAMATVTHPDYRGRGLFKKLASLSFACAKSEGYEFVVGVANANAFPGLIKYFHFKFITKLNVKIGYGTKASYNDGIRFSGYWNRQSMNWRFTCNDEPYQIYNDFILGKYKGIVRTFMGRFNKNYLPEKDKQKKSFSLVPILYVGTGIKLRGLYFTVPKFIKHSPFNLIFMDLTNGRLPEPNKNNFCFQLFDFDVA